MVDMQEWLLEAYEDDNITLSELRQALEQRGRARQIWIEFSDSADFVDDCQEQIRIFLEKVQEVA